MVKLSDISQFVSVQMLYFSGLRAPNPRQGRRPCTCFGRHSPSSHGVISVCARSMAASPILRLFRVFTLPFLSDATSSARLRAAVFRKHRFPRPPSATKPGGRFCGTFYRRPCATFYGGAGLVYVAPRKGSSPLTSARSRPCTCPEPLFIVAQGLCSTYRLAVKKHFICRINSPDTPGSSRSPRHGPNW